MRMYKNTAAFVRCNPKNQSSLFPLLVYGEEEIEKNRLLPPPPPQTYPTYFTPTPMCVCVCVSIATISAFD